MSRRTWLPGAVIVVLALAMRFRGAQPIAMPVLVQGRGAQRQNKTATRRLLVMLRQLSAASHPSSRTSGASKVMEKFTKVMKLVKHMKVVVALKFEVTEPTNGTYASFTPPRRGMR